MHLFVTFHCGKNRKSNCKTIKFLKGSKDNIRWQRKKDKNMPDIEKIFTSDFRNYCALYGALVSRRDCQRGNILRIFAEISRSFSRDAEIFSAFPEIYRCTWRDVFRHDTTLREKGRKRRGGAYRR